MLIKAEDYKTGMSLETGVLYNGLNGTYRYADNKMYAAVIKVPTPYGGEELKEQIVGIKLPKIPFEMFDKIYEFFKHVYKEYKAEVAILLWYNFETKIWETEVPKQTVSGGSVRYTRDEEWTTAMEIDGFLCVGTIHSHCEMSAFHSGTDDADEYNFDGVHITIGKVLSGPEFAQRFIVKEMSKKFEDITDVVDFPEKENEKYPTDWFEQVSKGITPSTGWRKPSLLRGDTRERDAVMRFNTDGSLRKPWETNQETKEVEEEIDEAEKKKRASYHFIEDKDIFRCPVCIEDVPENQLDKDWTCPSCSFPMWDNDLDYDLDYVKNEKTGEEDAVAFKDQEDDYLRDAINEDLRTFY